MDQKLPEEDTIRQYLLGTLPEPELSRIEEKLLSSDELSETADLLEDEIIEQYLDGELDQREQRAVETHFLRPPSHLEKLRFARLLRHQFELSPVESETVTHRIPFPPPLRQHLGVSAGEAEPVKHAVLFHPFRSHLWSYGGALAAVVLAAVSVYLGMAEHALKKNMAVSKETEEALRSELNKERERSASLSERLEALQATAFASLDLRPGITRSSGSVPQATIQPATRFVKVDVVLPKLSSVSFKVRLVDERTGYEVWSKSGLKPVPGAPRLLFDVPTQGIRPGPYKLVVEATEGSGVQSYPFDADMAQ